MDEEFVFALGVQWRLFLQGLQHNLRAQSSISIGSFPAARVNNTHQRHLYYLPAQLSLSLDGHSIADSRVRYRNVNAKSGGTYLGGSCFDLECDWLRVVVCDC